MSEPAPTYDEIAAARAAVYAHLSPTPLVEWPGLSELLSAHVFVKHENHLPTGAFKVRGGVHLASTLDGAAKSAGLFTASTGNHGQSIAFGGRAAGVPVRIAVPEGANEDKVAAMRGFGAEVVYHGRDFDEAREWIQCEAKRAGARFIGPTQRELIVGVGTYAIEIVEALPDVEAIFVPVGAGSGACGVCTVAKHVDPQIRVVGVQASAAPAMQLAWSGHDASAAGMATRAEGLATRVPFENTQAIMRDPTTGLDDFVLVSDEAMEDAIRLLLRHTHNLAEHAGAAALAAAIACANSIRGRKVVLVLSGANLSMRDLARIVAGS